MTGDLERAREIRALLAAGTTPPGWPTHVWAGVDEGGEVTVDLERVVPKCSMIECCEPGVIEITFRSLVDVTSSSVYACLGHVDHFAAAGREWIR